MLETKHVEVKEDFGKEYDSYVIAYCPDTDEFFVTNQRYFFWQTEKEFATQKEAYKYFEENIRYFWEIKKEILSAFVYDWVSDKRVWLVDTENENNRKEQVSDRCFVVPAGVC